MLDHTGVLRELGRERLRVLDRPEVAIEDEVALVGAVGLTPISETAHHDRGAEQLDRPAGGREAEVDDLDREREARPETVGALGSVDDDDLACARLRHQLLAQQRAAAALDQVEGRVDLVRTVDRDVDLPGHVAGEQRDRRHGAPRRR